MTAILNILIAAFSATGARSIVVTRGGIMVYLDSDAEIIRIATEHGVDPQLRNVAGITWLALDVPSKDGMMTLIGPDQRAAEAA